MYGAFIGDIVGSIYEVDNIKTKDFPLLSEGCGYSDDTVMTAAVAKAIIMSRETVDAPEAKSFSECLVEAMQDFGRRIPTATGGYGRSFYAWLHQAKPRPYGSYGNGSAMRVSPCALAAVNMQEAISLARISAAVTHDHPEGIKGAEAVAAAIFLIKKGRSKEQIRSFISDHYYNLDFTLDEIRPCYSFDVSCQGSVPQAIAAFLESDSFEDAIRSAVSIGGDSDTIAAITGSMAWLYYALESGGYEGWVYEKLIDVRMREIKQKIKSYLPRELTELAEEFHELCWRRAGTYYRTGYCRPIITGHEAEHYRPSPESPIMRDYRKLTEDIEEFMD